MLVLTSLLADEDARVRQRAASSLAKLSKNIFHDRGNIAYEKTKLIYQEFYFSLFIYNLKLDILEVHLLLLDINTY